MAIPYALMDAIRKSQQAGGDAPLLSEPSIPKLDTGAFQDTYQPDIEAKKHLKMALMHKLMEKMRPQRAQNPLRPGAAGATMLAALLAKLAGAQNRDINQGVGALVGSAAHAQDVDFANQNDQYEADQRNTGMEIGSLDDEIKSLMGMRDDARNDYRYTQARNDRTNERNEDYLHGIERDRANREFKGNADDRKNRKDMLKALLAKASAEARPAIIGQMGLGLDPEAVSAMGELNEAEKLQVKRGEGIDSTIKLNNKRSAKMDAEITALGKKNGLTDAQTAYLKKKTEMYSDEFAVKAFNAETARMRFQEYARNVGSLVDSRGKLKSEALGYLRENRLRVTTLLNAAQREYLYAGSDEAAKDLWKSKIDEYTKELSDMDTLDPVGQANPSSNKSDTTGTPIKETPTQALNAKRNMLLQLHPDRKAQIEAAYQLSLKQLNQRK